MYKDSFHVTVAHYSRTLANRQRLSIDTRECLTQLCTHTLNCAKTWLKTDTVAGLQLEKFSNNEDGIKALTSEFEAAEALLANRAAQAAQQPYSPMGDI